jgi:hypothetical protein
MEKGRLEIPLDGGVLEIRFRFIPSEERQLSFDLGGGKNPPATREQRELLDSLSRRLGRKVNLDGLSKKEASSLIQKMLVEVKAAKRR